MQLAIFCFVAALGGLLFGYDWVVIGGAKPFYEPYFGITESPYLQGFTMSSALVGCLIGSVLSGALADGVGRKRLLLLTSLLFLASAIGTSLAPSLAVFNAFRIVGGMGIGLASNLSPMYISEIAPPNQRGRLVSLNQVAIVIGILTSQIVNWCIAEDQVSAGNVIAFELSWNVTTGWRWMFAAQSVPSVAFLVGMLFLPESPRWLVSKNRTSEASAVLVRFVGPEQAHIQLQEMIRSNTPIPLNANHTTERPPMKHMLTLGIFLAVFQQWCGINVMFNYAQEIFSAAGYSVNQILWNIVITGVVNFSFTLIAVCTVDLVGRRFLMLVGSGGLFVIYLVLGTCFYYHVEGLFPLILVSSAIACYAMSLAPVTWVVLSEMFPVESRGLAMSKCVLALWLSCGLLTLTFPILNDALGPHGILWFYGGVCLVGFIAIAKVLPETKPAS